MKTSLNTMKTLLDDHRIHIGWLLLVAATVASYALRSEGSIGPAIGLTTLAITYLKGRVVVLDFMELRHAPLVWRAIFEGWLLLLTLLVLTIYGGPALR
jgi:hypothetical protein